jgi:hypothetical protein
MHLAAMPMALGLVAQAPDGPSDCPRTCVHLRAAPKAPQSTQSKALAQALKKLTAGGTEMVRRSAADELAAHVKAHGVESLEVRKVLLVAAN